MVGWCGLKVEIFIIFFLFLDIEVIVNLENCEKLIKIKLFDDLGSGIDFFVEILW